MIEEGFIKIRSAKKSDLKRCKRIFRVSEVKEANGKYLTAGFMAYYLDKDYFLVAEYENKLVGALFGESLKGNGVMLFNFAILKNYRNKDIGSLLLKRFEKNALKNGGKWILIYAPIKNKQTLKFYKKHNYYQGSELIEYLKLLNKKTKIFT